MKRGNESAKKRPPDLSNLLSSGLGAEEAEDASARSNLYPDVSQIQLPEDVVPTLPARKHFPAGRLPSRDEVMAANSGKLWGVGKKEVPPTLVGKKTTQSLLEDEEDCESNTATNPPNKPPVPQSWPKAKASLLDDEDDEEIDERKDGKAHGTSAVPLETSFLGPNEDASLLKADASTEKPPKVWGRKKADLPSLEEDTMDAKELEFADDTALVQHQMQFPQDFATGTPGAHSHENTIEDDQLKAAILESQKMQEEAKASRTQLSVDEIEETKENARTLRSLVGGNNVDLEFLNNVLSMCRADHRRLSKVIEEAMLSGENAESLNIDLLIDLNSNVLNAIEAGESRISGKSEEPADEKPESRRSSRVNRKRNDLDVQDLVIKRDIFSLICVLRMHHDEKRAEAAMALVRFARGAEMGDKECVALREEIRSSGGLHSLLTLFRTVDIPRKLRAMAALAVAYVLPSYAESESQPSASLCMKIVDCMRFLVDQDEVAHNGEVVSKDEVFEATARALTTFWINYLEPPLDATSDMKDIAPVMNGLSRNRSWGRPRGRMADQYGKNATMNELLDATVTLIISIAKRESENERNKGSFKWSATLVEQCCALERARASAVRRGILQVLVSWIRSGDKERVRPAASALRYVTSIQDNYLAGWIHSEIVSKGAVNGLMELTTDPTLTHDVRLAITQILSSLCAAPHTRAAVLEANCIHFLIGIIYACDGKSNDDLAYYASSAIVQLTASAIARASIIFDHNDSRIGDFVSPQERDHVLGEILNSGVLASFSSIVAQSEGKLRSIAIQALQVISDDVIRDSRLQLCEIGAAKSLGKALQQNLSKILKLLTTNPQELDQYSERFYRDIWSTLHTLSNILDPSSSQDVRPTINSRNESSSSIKEPQQFLVQGCIDLASSGGLEAMLTIANLPFDASIDSANCFLVNESCRSLCSLAPILLTKKVASSGYSKWAHSLWLAFHQILGKLRKQTMIGQKESVAADIYLDVLNGLGILAKSEPLKVRIIEMTVPHLLEAKNMGEQEDISAAASQALQYLDITRDELSAQIVGNSANFGAEWFCLQRSFLLQAMARTEIRRVVYNLWSGAYNCIEHDFFTSLVRLSSETIQPQAGKRNAKGLFCEFSDDLKTEKTREALISEYNDIYGVSYAEGELSDCSATRTSSLLSYQAYPFSSSNMETKWILEHGQTSLGSELTGSLSNHVEQYLRVCFPSKLLREQVVPMQLLKPKESFNFRSIIMAQRKYFSFRREGQLIANLLEKEGPVLGSGKLHCTLNFRNSSFGGEFSESLVQVLYKCSVINGLSFVRDSSYADYVNDEVDDSFGLPLSSQGLPMSLLGAFPPWVSHITFDGIVEDSSMDTLLHALKSMGNLSSSRQSIEPSGDGKQNALAFFSIRNSPSIATEKWKSFIELFGNKTDISRGLSCNVMTSLVSLDLSGNDLGDSLAGSLLHTLLNGNRSCSLQELDLSRNRIQTGANCLEALRTYKASLVANPKQRKTTLFGLFLASNGLMGKIWIELLSLLQDNSLKLRRLDLSANGIVLQEKEFEFANHAVRTLTTSNSCLQVLDLSRNRLSAPIVDHILDQLVDSRGRNSVLLVLNENHPPLSANQAQALNEVSEVTRRRMLRAYVREIEESQEFSAPSDKSSIYEATIPEDKSVSTYTSDQRFLPEDSPIDSEMEPVNRNNSITVLFSAPLVFTDGRTLRPFAKLDFDLERELIWQCLKEASRDIELSFDSATHERLLATMAKRCGCLHYSGHGHQMYLPFEDGSGGPYWFKVDQFKSLIEKDGGAPFRFVFVSACFSYLAGETFASAGVPHVVCCQQESELKDTAALAFTRQFYLALAIGHTVRDAFDQGCKAVRATPNLKNPDQEMKKFLLLPENGNHNVPIFDAKPIPEWPRTLNEDARWRRRSVVQGAKSSELSVRNMMQEDPAPTPPEFFLGREIEMYYTLKAVLGKRLVSVTGEPGVGRSSLACALCHYINERATTIIGIEHIYYIKARKSRKRTPLQSAVQRLRAQLLDTDNGKPVAEVDDDLEEIFDFICNRLKHRKVLVVFDRVEHIVDRDDEKEFPMLLSKLLRETKNVKILLTNVDELGIPALGEHPIGLGPLKFSDTVRLFASLCPYLHTPTDRRKLFETLVTNKEEAELLSTDPGVGETTKGIFFRLGDGIPSLIEKAAYELSKEEFLELYKTV